MLHIAELSSHIYLIDLEPAGIKNFSASYILKGSSVAIIETGPALTVQNLILGLRRLSIKPEEVTYVAVSHIHIDHSGAAGTLLKHLPKAKLIVHPRGAPHIANPELLWTKSREALGKIAELYGEPKPISKERIIAADDGEIFNVGDNIKLRTIETLGHASHHLAYYETSSQGIFLGDSAGIYLNKLKATLPTTPAPHRLDIARKSLNKLIEIKPKVLYYSHFGETLNPGEKLQTYKKQLEIWEECAKDGIAENENIQSIRTRIIERDTTLQRVEKYLRNHPILGQTVLNQSVEGIIEYVRSSMKSQKATTMRQPARPKEVTNKSSVNHS